MAHFSGSSGTHKSHSLLHCLKLLLIPLPIYLFSSMYKLEYNVLIILKYRLTRHCVGIQIGQVMLALPNAVALTGLRAGVPLLFMYSLFSIFTIHLLNALYCEYKARKVSILHQGVPVTTAVSEAVDVAVPLAVAVATSTHTCKHSVHCPRLHLSELE